MSVPGGGGGAAGELRAAREGPGEDRRDDGDGREAHHAAHGVALLGHADVEHLADQDGGEGVEPALERVGADVFVEDEDHGEGGGGEDAGADLRELDLEEGLPGGGAAGAGGFRLLGVVAAHRDQDHHEGVGQGVDDQPDGRGDEPELEEVADRKAGGVRDPFEGPVQRLEEHQQRGGEDVRRREQRHQDQEHQPELAAQALEELRAEQRERDGDDDRGEGQRHGPAEGGEKLRVLEHRGVPGGGEVVAGGSEAVLVEADVDRVEHRRHDRQHHRRERQPAEARLPRADVVLAHLKGSRIEARSNRRCPSASSPISVSVMIAETAMASGKSRAMIACVAMRPALTAPGPPRVLGISATPRPLTRMKTVPAKTPGAASGRITSLNTRHRGAPMSAQTSNTWRGAASIARKPQNTMKGRKLSTSPMTTPVGVKRIEVIGSEITPNSISVELTRPFRPRTGRSMKVRTISETMKGRMKSSITRCCAISGMRRRTKTAMGKPITKQMTTAIEEWPIEERKLPKRAERKKFS